MNFSVNSNNFLNSCYFKLSLKKKTVLNTLLKKKQTKIFFFTNLFLLKWFEFLFKFEHFFFFDYFLFCIKKRYKFVNLVKQSRIIKDYKSVLNFFDYYYLNFLSNSLSFKLNLNYCYLISSSFIVFRLDNDLFLYKNFLLNSIQEKVKNFFTLKNNFKNYFLKNVSLDQNFYFVKYRLYGLGFKIKKVNFLNQRILSLEIGLGHKIYYLFSEQVKCLRRKRHFFIFTSNFQILNIFSYHFSRFKKLNPYKIRGIKDVKLNLKMKKGKKQGQKK